MGNPSRLPNATARNVYLKALQLEWPEVLSGLQNDVFPRVAQLWTERLAADDRGLFTRKLQQFEEALAAKEVDQALKFWANTFSIEDEWMLENARTTMYMYGVNWSDLEAPWTGWVPAGPLHLLRLQAFDMKISELWIPPKYGGRETWEIFSGRLKSRLKKELGHYRRRQSEHFGVQRDNAERDARWTVKYQKGTLAAEIAEGLPRRYEDPGQTVWKSIERFAKDIGLTLHQSRRHRTRK